MSCPPGVCMYLWARLGGSDAGHALDAASAPRVRAHVYVGLPSELSGPCGSPHALWFSIYFVVRKALSCAVCVSVRHSWFRW